MRDGLTASQCPRFEAGNSREPRNWLVDERRRGPVSRGESRDFPGSKTSTRNIHGRNEDPGFLPTAEKCFCNCTYSVQADPEGIGRLYSWTFSLPISSSRVVCRSVRWLGLLQPPKGLAVCIGKNFKTLDWLVFSGQTVFPAVCHLSLCIGKDSGLGHRLPCQLPYLVYLIL